MKTVTLNIIKKNRVYFACEDKNKKAVKLKIDSNSESLTLGTHELLVNDVSVKSKYGVDAIYELAVNIEEQKSAGICTLQHFAYNQNLVEECKKLGGKWDEEAKAWVFSDVVQKEVEALDAKYNEEIMKLLKS